MKWTSAAARRPAWVACGLALRLCACEAQPQPERAPAPTGVVDLEGRPVDPLVNDPADGATVLVFVSTECPISNRYAPTLARLSASWTGSSVRAWLVYPDPDDDAEAILRHLASHELTWSVVRDPAHALARRAGVTVTPEAAVFAAGAEAPAYRGRIDDRVVAFGKIRPEAAQHDLRDAVEAVLRHEAPASPTQPAIGCYISDLR